MHTESFHDSEACQHVSAESIVKTSVWPDQGLHSSVDTRAGCWKLPSSAPHEGRALSLEAVWDRRHGPSALEAHQEMDSSQTQMRLPQRAWQAAAGLAEHQAACRTSVVAPWALPRLAC